MGFCALRSTQGFVLHRPVHAPPWASRHAHRPRARVQVLRDGGSRSSGNEAASASETEVELEELQRTVLHLETVNQELKTELDSLVTGLAAVLTSARAGRGEKLAAHSAEPAAASTADQPASQAVSGSSTTRCVLQHPGALCCTTITESVDVEAGSATWTIQTTARRACDGGLADSLGVEELGVLAAQALTAAAVENARVQAQLTQSHAHPEQHLQRHDEVTRILAEGHIVSAQRNKPSQFGHESFCLELQDKVTGRRLRAIFKPRMLGDAGGWHRAPMEWVAYRLNLMLGMDLVPPVAYRKDGVSFSINDEQLQFAEGAMMFWTESASMLQQFPESEWGCPKQTLLSDTRILDVLLHNSDRHQGHFLLGRHWSEGKWVGGVWVGDMRPVLIDHAASFREDAHVSMSHENAFRTGPVRCVRASTYLRLRFLDPLTMSNEFSPYLDDQEMRDLLQRRNYVLRYLDRLVEEQGYQATVMNG